MMRISYAMTAAVALTVIGMMLVVGGVIVTGLFLPGAVVIAISMIGYAVAAILHTREAS